MYDAHGHQCGNNNEIICYELLVAETVNLLSYCYMIYPLVSWRHLICNEFIMVNLCILWSPSDCGRTLILSFFGQKIRFCMHVADKSPLKRKSSRAYLDFKRENGIVKNTLKYMYSRLVLRVDESHSTLALNTGATNHFGSTKRKRRTRPKKNFLNDGQKFQLDYSTRFCIGNMKRDIASLNISSV